MMLDVVSPFILWPIGMALGGLLFLEITKRSSGAEQSVVALPRRGEINFAGTWRFV